MESYPIDDFIREYTAKIDEGRAALFCGAGTSIAVGMEDWKGLLAGIAKRLGLHIELVNDLVELAQFSFNERGTRQEIHELIINEFGRLAKAGPLHQELLRLPIDTIWTTNYDTVIEDAYRHAGFRPDVKISEGSLAAHPRLADVTIYKMHGDVNDADRAVLTKEDYDRYPHEERGRVFLAALEMALLSQTFLFLGFSFSDPNVDRILGILSVLYGLKMRPHYCIMKRPSSPAGEGAKRLRAEFDYRLTELRVKDLKERFKINTVLVDDYNEIPQLLARLSAASRRNYVFVSGAAYDYAPLGEQRLLQLADALGRGLARRGKYLISGVGRSIGQDVVAGFFQESYAHEAREQTDRAILRPFPQRLVGSQGSPDEFWERYRRDMIRHAGFTIYIAGTRRGVADMPELSAGMRQEFDIGHELGAIPIPIGASGGMSAELYATVRESPECFYPPGVDLATELAVLGNSTKSDQEWLDATFSIMDKVISHMGVS